MNEKFVKLEGTAGQQFPGGRIRISFGACIAHFSVLADCIWDQADGPLADGPRPRASMVAPNWVALLLNQELAAVITAMRQNIKWALVPNRYLVRTRARSLCE